jgi:hypothetical protein
MSRRENTVSKAEDGKRRPASVLKVHTHADNCQYDPHQLEYEEK